MGHYPSMGSVYTDPNSSRLSMRQSVRGSVSSTSPPPSTGHGSIARQRRFNSRHVPEQAEELVSSPLLSNDMVSRFNGLMRHLKNNSEWEEQQKQVMVANVEALVPEEFEDVLQSEFERRCAFGERMNTELMSSAKYVKLLKECGAIIPPDADKRGNRPLGAIPLVDADVIFVKVIHDCDYGGKRLTYDLLCKALYLVARQARPDLSAEAAFHELLARIASVAPEDPDRGNTPDLMLDPNVLLKLEDFKPALYDLFKTFCSRNLGNPANSRPGTGSVRLSERSFWKHTQETTGLTAMARSSMYGPGGRGSFNGTFSGESPTNQAMMSPSSSTTCQNREQDTSSNMLDIDGTTSTATLQPATGSPTHSPVPSTTAGGTGEAVEKPDRESSSQVEGESTNTTSQLASQNAEADAGGGIAGTSRRPQALQEHDAEFSGRSGGDRRGLGQSSSPRTRGSLKVDQVEPILEDRIPGVSSPHALDMVPTGSLSMMPTRSLDMMATGSLPMNLPVPGNTLHPGSTMLSVSNTMYSDPCTGISQDPYVYANGAPVIKNRRRHMSVSQMLLLCKELKIVPDLLSRLEVVRIFKRAQCAGSHSSLSSLYGYLTAEAFIDAAGQLALESYSKPPYNEEYPEPYEKIHAFFCNILRDASSSREVHERFFYGCSGRGR